MEIWFYHLTRQPLEAALPTLLERSLARGWRAVVQARSPERLAAIDERLWTYSDEAFLPHGMARDGDPDLQPVYLTTGDETPNGARVRFFVEGAEIGPALAVAKESDWERFILMFDGADPDDLAAARTQWKALKERGVAMSYWRQTEAGGWEKQA